MPVVLKLFTACTVYLFANLAAATVIHDIKVLLGVLAITHANSDCESGSCEARLSDRVSLIQGLVSLSGTFPEPPEVPHDGVRILKSLDLDTCNLTKGDKVVQKHNMLTQLSDSNSSNLSEATASESEELRKKRRAFVCAAGCSEREPQLEESLAPWADWMQNTSGSDMISSLEGFCTKTDVDNPFIIIVLWQGDVYLKACKRKDVHDGSLYLIGPEDLSLVLIFLLSAQQIAALPAGPIAFGMYLSDYTSVLDRHLVGPGLPIFAYLGRATSWLIPWPSSTTVQSTMEVEDWQHSHNLQTSSKAASSGALMQKSSPEEVRPWEGRDGKAYWIGAVTGPWSFTLDSDIMAIPRLKLLKMAKDHPKQILAEWSAMAGYGISWVTAEERVAGFLAPHSRSVAELTGVAKSAYKDTNSWDNFKYYINLDGVVLGGRLNKLLSLGGVVLQHQAGYIEHMNGLLKPYEHFVPIEYDLSDLVAKVEWLQRNDTEAKRIAANGRKLASERMRLEDHLCYAWRALEALGSKTADANADSRKVAFQLKEYARATVNEDGMRPTLESFWGGKLEEVTTGDRVMSKDGIELLERVWKRFEGIYEKAQKYM